MRRRIRRVIWVSLILTMLGGWLAWCFPNQVLTLDSGVAKAELLVVLGGGSGERSKRAAELFKEGAAPRVICTGDGDCEQNRSQLIAAGVPPEVIEIECDSRSTRENALYVIKRMQEQKIHSAIIVTSWYHSRRAYHCFCHYGPGMTFYSRPSNYGYARNTWKREGISHYINAEYIKLAGYWIRYGVPPF